MRLLGIVIAQGEEFDSEWISRFVRADGKRCLTGIFDVR